MSTLSKFPLLKLPILSIEHVLIQCYSYELFYLSLLSKKCHRLVKTLNYPFNGFVIRVTKNETLVQIGWNETSYGNWYFNCDDIGKNEQITRSIGGCEMKTCIMDRHFYLYVNENIQLSVKAGIQYLMDLFKLPILRVDLHPDEISQSRRPLLVGFSECKEVLIRGKNPMNHDELRDIIERIFPTEFVFLFIPIDESFYCNLKSKRLRVENDSKWVKLQQLFDWKFVSMTLISSCLQPKELEMFVINWFHSNRTDFEFLGVTFEEPVGKFNFKSLPLMPWSEKRRSHAYKYDESFAIDCSDGMDFFRKDGLLATIVFKPTFFHFCVWHTRFHDVTGLIC